MRILIFAIAAIVFILTRATFAQLKWETRELELKPTFADKESIATYAFSNPTDHAVTIMS